MENLRVYLTKQSSGYGFSILPNQKLKIIEEFGDRANPASFIVVNYGRKSNFQSMLGWLETAVLPLLLGMYNQEDLKKIKTVSFYDPESDTKIEDLDLYEQSIS
jgi:hypothetical protein